VYGVLAAIKDADANTLPGDIVRSGNGLIMSMTRRSTDQNEAWVPILSAPINPAAGVATILRAEYGKAGRESSPSTTGEGYVRIVGWAGLLVDIKDVRYIPITGSKFVYVVSEGTVVLYLYAGGWATIDIERVTVFNSTCTMLNGSPPLASAPGGGTDVNIYVLAN
jgi:hypothetical protein